MTALQLLGQAAGHLVSWLWIFVTVDMTRGLFLFALALALLRAFPALSRRSGPYIWLLILGSLILLPLARLTVPSVRLGPVMEPVSRLAAASSQITERVVPAVSVASSGKASPDPMTFLLAGVWLTGFLFFLSRSVTGRAMAGRLAARSIPCRPGFFPVSELTARLGIRRSVTFLLSSRCAVPFTFGLLHPCVLLPPSSRSWSPARLRAVLSHELSHVRRLDALWNLVINFICSVVWFLPHAWMALSFLQQETEKACDRAALDHGTRGAAYAATIVDLSREARGRLLVPGTFGLTGRKSMLKDRIVNVLSWTRGEPPLRVASRALIAGFIVVLPLLALTCSGKAEKFVGTWVNTSSIAGNYKYTYNSDGTGSYVNRDGTMKTESRYTIEKKWTDEKGNTWYDIKFRWHIAPYQETGAETFYALMKVDPKGEAYEVDGSRQGYPTQLYGEAGSGHGLFKRQ